jgi:lipopolysaccharide export system protein LptC
MSEIAEIERSKRRIWARPGSSHDYVIRALRVLLPAGAGVLLAFLVTAPLTGSASDVSFMLAKDSVDIAKERLRVTEAVYRGEDNKGRPFALHAGSAVQKTSREPIIRISDFEARIELSDGPANVTAQKGRYDMDRDILNIDGPMVLQSTDGYQLSANNVNVNLNARTLTSDSGGVNGRMPIGTFSANQLRVDLEGRVVTLDGRAHLHIDQGFGR